MVKKNMKREGFTLVELLVVIAIIGLLSTLSIVALNNARLRSRDAARVADVKQWQTALELFYSDVGKYPDQSATSEPDSTTGLQHGGTIYMANIPSNPKPWGDGNCTALGNGGVAQDFWYTSTSVTSYTIWYCLGSATGGVKTGVNCATPAGLSDGTGCVNH